MRLSILAHALSTDLRAALAAARQHDFAGVVIDPNVFSEVITDSQTARREIIALLSRHEQPLVGIDMRLDPTTGFGPRGDMERELDRITRAMNLARGLHCPMVLCDLGPMPPAIDEPAPAPVITKALLGGLILPETPSKPKPTQPPAARDPAFESSLEVALRELGMRADRAGCLVAFRASLGSFASIAESLMKVDCPWFGVDVDPVALLADQWTIDEVFSRVGRLIRHVRGRDGIRGSGARVVPTAVGKGQIDWRELLTGLRDCDYDATITLDPIELPDRTVAATRGANLLRELIG